MRTPNQYEETILQKIAMARLKSEEVKFPSATSRAKSTPDPKKRKRKMSKAVIDGVLRRRQV